ncbi:MAG: hypothetical protein E3K37_05585 [Candidatus Kuenenia sp.]|nr:hypothetical protein [Candidatus Kuenenia hertensis]
MSEKPRPFIRMLIACLLFFITVTLYTLLPRYWHNIPEIIKHLLLVFSAIMCIHLMEYAFFWWEIFGHMKNIIQETLLPTNQLINENRNQLENFFHTSNQLTGTAATCGLVNIYVSRKDIKHDIYDSINNAKKRMWLQGIAHSEIVPLDDLLFSFNEKISCEIDCKILLLDAHQAQAVFRTFMESSPSEVDRIINTDRSKIPPFEPFFHQGVYSDFAHACDRIRNYSKIRDNVRFYTHSPNCWLIIIDETAFFQPYSFGKDPTLTLTDVSIGIHMPVFKFQMLPDAIPFKILEDHFLKLWTTSNIDLFHAEARITDRHHIIKDLFNRHSWWFKQLHGILHVPKDNNNNIYDRRKFPRQPWKWNLPLSLHIYLDDCEKTTTITNIYDYSREGMLLQLENISGLSIGQIVSLHGSAPAEPFEANFVIDHFLKITSSVIVRIAGELPLAICIQTVYNNEVKNKQ